MRLNETARGVFVIAVTPFTDSGELDFASTDRLVDFYLERGATGLTILGIMGEAPKLTAEESRRFVRAVLARVAGRVPVVVGVSSPGFATMRELTADCMDAGAAGVMVAPPAAVRTDDELVNYFGQVVTALGDDVPWVLQDFPQATGVRISLAVLRRVFTQMPSCVMLKHEDWPGLAKISAVRADEAAGQRRVSILCGNGGLFLPEEMARGADGAMTGFAFPEMMAGVVAAHAAHDRARGQDIFDAYLPLCRYEQQAGIGLAVRKFVLARRGAIATARLRAPGPSLSAQDVAEVEFLLGRQQRRLESLG